MLSRKNSPTSKERRIFQKNSPPTKKQRTNPKMRKLVMVSRFVYLQTNRSNPQSILKDTLQKTNRIEIVNNHACEEKNLISRLGPLPMDTSSCFLLENVSETTKEDRLDATRVPRVYGGNWAIFPKTSSIIATSGQNVLRGGRGRMYSWVCIQRSPIAFKYSGCLSWHLRDHHAWEIFEHVRNCNVRSFTAFSFDVEPTNLKIRVKNNRSASSLYKGNLRTRVYIISPLSPPPLLYIIGEARERWEERKLKSVQLGDKRDFPTRVDSYLPFRGVTINWTEAFDIAVFMQGLRIN